MSDLMRRLAQAEVFGKLPEGERASLVEQATRRRLLSGMFLCHQDECWPYVLFVLRGELRWTILSAGGQEYTLYTTGADRLVFSHSAFDDEPMPASVIAQQTTDLLLWSREQMMPVLFHYPAAMWDIGRMQVRTMRRAREIIYGLAFQPVAGRLAKHLLDRCQEEDMAAVSRDLTLSDIASMIATSPEVVCRLLHQFQTDGILEITRAQITLQNRQALERLVEMT